MTDGRKAPCSAAARTCCPQKLPTLSWGTVLSAAAPSRVQDVLVPPDRTVTDRQRLSLGLKGPAKARGWGLVGGLRVEGGQEASTRGTGVVCGRQGSRASEEWVSL